MGTTDARIEDMPTDKLPRWSDVRLVELQAEFEAHKAAYTEYQERTDTWQKEVSESIKILIDEKKDREAAMKFIKIMATIIGAGAAAWAWVLTNLSDFATLFKHIK